MTNDKTKEKEEQVQQTDESKEQAEATEDVESLRRQRDEYLDMALRSRAEFENYQKRTAREREQERKHQFGPLLFDMLPVLDNLERAIDAAKKGGETGSLVEGVVIVHSQFVELLRRYGVTRIEAQDQPFDPNIHQAMMQQPSEEHEPGTVIQVIEQGYMSHDRVLRPSKVIVSAKPGS